MNDDATPVGIDTNIVIYAQKSESDFRKIKDMDQRREVRTLSRCSVRLLTRLQDSGHPIFLSAISLGEYLVRVEPDVHVTVTRELSKLLTVVDFNQRAASIAAGMVDCSKELNSSMRLKIDRPVLMADIKIIASLVAANVKTIYFNDMGACKIGKQVVDARMLPTNPSDLIELIEDRDAASSEPE